MATLSFVPQVFQPTLTFFPGNGNGEDTNTAREEIGEGVRNTTEATEASVCTQLVSRDAEPIVRQRHSQVQLPVAPGGPVLLRKVRARTFGSGVSIAMTVVCGECTTVFVKGE